MKVFRLKLTDGGGDSGYAVKLTKEASNWEDDSSAGHQIYELAQRGNVNSFAGGLACVDGGETPLKLIGANWSMVVGERGDAHRQRSPADRIEDDWSWEVVNVSD